MNKFFKSAYLFTIYVFLYLPIAVLIIYSFNNARFSDVWHGMTFKWYKALFADHNLLVIAGHSLFLAILAASIAVFFGALASMAFFRYRFYGKKLLFGLIFVLIVVPDLVFGISLLVLYSALKIPLGFWTLLFAHITFCLPFAIITIYGRLKDMDKNMFEAAHDLGANEYSIFMRLILPLMAPALIAAWLLSFTLSMDDVLISFFVTGPSFQILPLYIYSEVHVGVTPEINALCTLILALTISLVLISQILVKKRS